MTFLTKTATILSAILDSGGTLEKQFGVLSKKDPQMSIALQYKWNTFYNKVNTFMKIR